VRKAVSRCLTLLAMIIVAAALFVQPLAAQMLLVPMDEAQENHLRAYGLVYWTIGEGESESGPDGSNGATALRG